MKVSREAILDEALTLFLDEGMAGLSMRKVARRVGVSATALYWHFENKDALVAEVFSDGLRVFSGYLVAALEGETPRERLQRTAEAFLRFGVERPRHFEVFFQRSHALLAEPFRSEFEVRRKASFRFLMDRVRECVDAGVLRPPGSVADTARLFLASAQGMVALHLTGQLETDDASFEALYRHSYALLAGLMTS